MDLNRIANQLSLNLEKIAWRIASDEYKKPSENQSGIYLGQVPVHSVVNDIEIISRNDLLKKLVGISAQSIDSANTNVKYDEIEIVNKIGDWCDENDAAYYTAKQRLKEEDLEEAAKYAIDVGKSAVVVDLDIMKEIYTK